MGDVILFLVGWFLVITAFLCGLTAIWATGPIQGHLGASAGLLGATGVVCLVVYIFSKI